MELKSTLEALIKIPEGWELSVITPYKAKYIWDHIKDKDILFPDGSFRTYEYFLVTLQRSVVYLHDKGYIRFDHICDSLSAQFHGAVWGISLYRNAGDIRMILSSFFLLYPIKRIFCILPIVCKAAKRALVEKVGFTEEGTLRCNTKYSGRYMDEYVLSILDTEVVYHAR